MGARIVSHSSGVGIVSRPRCASMPAFARSNTTNAALPIGLTVMSGFSASRRRIHASRLFTQQSVAARPSGVSRRLLWTFGGEHITTEVN